MLQNRFHLPLYWLILALGLVLQLGAVCYFTTHFDAAILRLMPDDAFYYFKIAQNVSHGLGSVFSVGEPTNGYHPLWLALLVSEHWLFQPDRQDFVTLVLLTSVLCNLLAADRLFQWLHTLQFSVAQGLVGVSVYLLSPWLVNLTLSGLETPLYLLCLFEFLRQTQRILDSSSGVLPANPVFWGISAGLLMLARTDSILFVGLALLLILLRYKAAGLRFGLLASLLALLLVSPWLVWNYLRFATIVQSSSLAISLLVHWQMPATITTWGYWAFAANLFQNVTYWATFAPLFSHSSYAIRFPLWNLLVWVLLAAALALALYRTVVQRNFTVPILLLMPVGAEVLFYCGIRLFAQVWHLSAAFILVLVYLLNFVPRQKLQLAPILSVLLIPLTILSLGNAYFRPQEWPGRVAYMLERYPRSPADSTTQGTDEPVQTVCHTDSGIPGYFSKHHVINMDGVVNNRVLTYIQAGRFSEYVKMVNCDVLIMDESRLAYYDRNTPAGEQRAAELAHR